MKIQIFNLIARSFAISFGSWLAATACADTPAFQGVSFSSSQFDFTGTVGWQFKASTGFYLTQLGVYDSGSDGLDVAHEVGFWRVDSRYGIEQHTTGTLLTSVTVPAGTVAPLAYGYRWVAIEPVFIPPDSIVTRGYMVGASYLDGTGADFVGPMAQPLTFAEPPVYANKYWGYTSANPLFEFPGQSNRPSDPENPFGRPYWEANFQFSTVPEPSAWCVFVMGLLLWWLRSARSHTRPTVRLPIPWKPGA